MQLVFLWISVNDKDRGCDPDSELNRELWGTVKQTKKKQGAKLEDND